MTWRERYRTASWRGVEFRVAAAGAAVGRRLARHEYPLRDLPWMEDLGRRARAYRVDGWVIGEDYDRERDRLITAAEVRGPGLLEHPYMGRLLVTCENLELFEDTREGGLARLSFLFVEAGRADAPVAAADTTGALEGAEQILRAAAQADFVERMTVLGQAGLVLDSITASIDQLTGYVTALPLTGFAGPVSRLITAANELGERVLDYAFDPTLIAGDLNDIAAQLGEAYRSKRDAIDALTGAGGIESPTFGGSGIQGTAAENGQAVVDLFAQAALGQAVVLAGELEWESLDDALALRGELVDALDAVILRPGIGDATYQALEGLRTALFGAVPPPDQDLPRLAVYTPATTLPSLVLAYGLWDAAERAGEITERNRVRRPGFVPGGEALEVINA